LRGSSSKKARDDELPDRLQSCPEHGEEERFLNYDLISEVPGELKSLRKDETRSRGKSTTQDKYKKDPEKEMRSTQLQKILKITGS